MKKKVTIIVMFLVILLLGVSLIFFINKDTDNSDNNANNNEIIEEKEEINVNDYYNPLIITNKDSQLFSINNNIYTKIGEVKKGSVLNLDKIVGEYFQVKGTEYYIHYKNVDKTDSILSNRYTKYINIGKSIVTNNNFKLYTDNDIFLTLESSMTFEVIYIDSDKYYVTFNDNLYYILKEDIDSITDIEVTNSSSNAKNVAVLNYHFIYDKTKYENCNESICIEKTLFEEHLKYLNESGFLTLTMNEFNLWMDGTLRIPEKSVLITFDDGALGTDTHLIELIEKYDMNATLFLITAWWPRSKYVSPNLEVYSHGYDIHISGYCSKGPKGLCLSKEELKNDLSLSIPLVDSNLAFCYPFYRYNNNMLNVLKELGVKLAFVGGNRKVKRTDNKLLLPRYVVYKNTSVNSLKNMVN